MKIRCPECGAVFTVKEDDYAAIVNQFKNAAIDEEVQARLKGLKHEWESNEENRRLATQGKFEKALGEKQNKITELLAKVNSIGNEKDLQYKEEISGLNLKIQKLEGELRNAVEAEKRNIGDARREEQENAKEALRQKEEAFKGKLQTALEEIDRLKEFKRSQSTKDVGESLEQYCHDQYEANLRPILPKAYFEKDNEVIEGTKGDFIFRDYAEDGTEYVSIMFEMKNEADETDAKNKKTNEYYLSRLDENRTKKKCDYAVLVSMLEQDSALYNRGIVDVSHKYPKMYVVRPQFFIPVLTLLMNAEKRNISIRQQLATVEKDNQEFTFFEGNLRRLKGLFEKHYKDASNNFGKVKQAVKDAIDELQKIEKMLDNADEQLGQADKNLIEMLDFKQISKKAPRIYAKLMEARKENEEAEKAYANPDEQ